MRSEDKRQPKQLTISVTIELDQLEAVLHKAVYDGSGYWLPDYAPVITTESGCVQLDLVNPPDFTDRKAPQRSLIDLAHIADAICRLFQEPPLCTPELSDVREEIAGAWPRIGDVDAATADVILQVAAFGAVEHSYHDEMSSPLTKDAMLQLQHEGGTN